MPEIRTVTTLKYKRDEIAASIRLYEKKLEQARADLAHVTAAIRILSATDRPQDAGRAVDYLRRCAGQGAADDQELALALMRAKGIAVDANACGVCECGG